MTAQGASTKCTNCATLSPCNHLCGPSLLPRPGSNAVSSWSSATHRIRPNVGRHRPNWDKHGRVWSNSDQVGAISAQCESSMAQLGRNRLTFAELGPTLVSSSSKFGRYLVDIGPTRFMFGRPQPMGNLPVSVCSTTKTLSLAIIASPLAPSPSSRYREVQVWRWPWAHGMNEDLRGGGNWNDMRVRARPATLLSTRRDARCTRRFPAFWDQADDQPKTQGAIASCADQSAGNHLY